MERKKERNNKYIVGRKQELNVLRRLVSGQLPFSILNIYGPGGIGKTIVCDQFMTRCAQWGVPHAVVSGDALASARFEELLKEFRKGLERNLPQKLERGAFHDFDKRLDEYRKLKDIRDGGEINSIFNAAGRLVEQTPYKPAIDLLKGTYEGIQGYLSHRNDFDRYMDGADIWLTKSFVKGLDQITAKSKKIVLFIDTFEAIPEWNHWLCNTFVKELPDEIKVIILGRDKLNVDWNEQYGTNVNSYELQELDELDAKDYLRHFGLEEKDSLDRVYAFTGGYPLCLMLAVELAKKNDGMDWNQVQGFQNIADRAQVASQLLERILQQTAVREIKEFLEKGVILEWFDPQAVSYILNLDAAKGVEIFEKIKKFSFIQRHPQGAKFHDRVRDLLIDRLKFNNLSEYQDLVLKWRNYLLQKAGV